MSWVQVHKLKTVVAAATERNFKIHDFLIIVKSESFLMSEILRLRNVKHEGVFGRTFRSEKYYFGGRIKNGKGVVSFEISLCGINVFTFTSLDPQY